MNGWRGSTGVAIITILLANALGSAAAWANGGPVAWTEGTPVGGISPRRISNIRLVAEDLRISVTDLNHYAVTARYELDNRGPEAAITYGVPVTHVPVERGRDAKSRSAALADSIRLQVGGRTFGCEIADVARGPYWDDEARLFTEDSPKNFDAGDGWCVANITIPSGGVHELVLQYAGEFEFEDLEYTSSALRYFSHRTLRYQLWPAAYWHGPVGQFSVVIDLGPYAGHDVTHSLPEAAVDSGTKLSWKGVNVDLARMRELRLDLQGDDLLLTQELARWNRRGSKYARVSVATSSSLVPEGDQRHDGDLMLDGDEATAWCAGGGEDGIGEWIELRIRKNYSTCYLEELAMLDSVRRGQTTYLAHNRIRKLRVAPCESPQAYRDITMSEAPRRADESAIEIRLDGAHVPVDLKTRPEVAKDRHYLELSAGDLRPFDVSSPPDEAPAKPPSDGDSEICLRLMILDVFPGQESHHTCVSELAPIIGCG